jgi:hypothetical protein
MSIYSRSPSEHRETSMKERPVVPSGDALRRAVRWLAGQPRRDAAAIEQACRRFDLSPADEEFLLRYFRTLAAGEHGNDG